MFCATLGLPMVSLGAASADSTYYAVFCSNDASNLSLASGSHAILGCNGSSPGIETTVRSLSSNPQGAHPVTIVEADCYPDAPSGSIDNGRILCSNGPSATLTMGKHFAANKAAAAAAKKKASAKKKSPAKKKGGSPGAGGGGSGALSQVNPGALPRSTADTGTIQNIIRIFFGIIGAFALLSMTASGLKYVTSGGDPGKTSEAKKGIVFALLGLMIAISAEAIVAYVVKNGAP